ncbi:hypothetical protein CDD80_1284 [Ophiocordyceps camponoti-rufipedis]|uniref:Carrier domain-containing protein n=1 Tax=Ophiocordyceps camponoti-rufipedis TaxID=2004952 RepID=A0A2C5XME1_9HYPO|nr:hypothetical protein CDD80_1284 [Ophiocordyceps camponoti-rufipedis]
MRYHVDPVCNGNGIPHVNGETTLKQAVKETLPRGLTDIWARNASIPETVEACVHSIFKKIACEQPSAPAVCSWDGNLSYGELDALSSRLAHRLVRLGVGPGKTVLLSFDKSMMMPIAALAVMKAGGASVALDVTLPEDHLRVVASQAAAPFILCSAANESLARNLISSGSDDQVVLVVVDPEQLSNPANKQQQHEQQQELPLVTPSDVLYIVFTSGSKGAMITHRNFSSAIAYQQKALGFDGSSRVYDHASYASHVAWFNLLHALTCGGCLCIPSEPDRRSNIAASIAELGATYAQLPPSVARSLSKFPSCLQRLNLVGEPASPLEAREHLNHHYQEHQEHHVATVSAYGQAETASLAAVWAATDASHPLPAGVCAWIVDAEDPSSLAPFGAEGELWLEGPLVGPGYLKDPDGTAEAFIQDPEWLLQGCAPKWPGRRGRVHRTGDLVRYDDAGQLVFVGHREQPRLRGGERIDASVVEHHLRRAAASVPDEDAYGLQLIAETIQPQGADDAVLVAFIALDGARDMPEREYGEAAQRVAARVSECLSASPLPPHMVPEAFIPIQAVPLTATGKVDRQCLRSIGSLLTESEMARLRRDGAGQTEFERLIAELWAQTLQMQPSSFARDDDFFASGGDATAALRLCRLARERELPLEARQVFRSPRLRDMAAWAATQKPWEPTPTNGMTSCLSETSSSSPLEPSSPSTPPFSLLARPVDEAEVRAHAARLCRVPDASVVDVMPCTPLQAGLLALTAQQDGAYVARNVLELGPDVDIGRFRASWEQVVALNPILRTRIVSLPRHGVVQVVLEEGVHWHSGSGDANDYVLDKASRPMGLGTPLSRFALFERGRQLVWEVHHALYDGWSLPLLMQEAEHVYYDETSPPLEPMTNLIKYISERDETATKTFWQSQFAGIKGAHFPAPPRSGATSYEPHPDSQITRAVSDLKWGQADVTPASVIRAAWAIMVAHSADSDEALFGLTVTGRQAAVPGIERMAGPAIATVPVRVVLNWDDSVSRLLGSVQKQAAEMIPYEQTGLQHIRRVSEAAAVACGFQSLLVIQPGGGGSGADDSSETANHRIFLKEPAADDENHVSEQSKDFDTYAVVVECQLDTDEVRLRIGFDSSVVGRRQMDRIVRGFESVLRLLCAEQHAKDRLRAAIVPSLSQASIDDIWRWNATVPAAVHTCIHDLVSQRARERPHAPAVCAWDGELTYGRLDELSTKLAHCLIARGVAGTVVPLFFEKSVWMPVAALAVMKAGAASIAMETTQPEERLRGIAAQAGSPVVLASVQKTSLARGLVSGEVITVGKDQPAPDASNSEMVSLPEVNPSSILYIVFTSGSTGTPKGAIVTHSNFASALAYQQQPLGFDTDSRVFDFASFAFDASWYNLVNALTIGGCLCIPSAEERDNNLSGCFEKYRVTTADLTPSVARFLGPETLSRLSTLILGGEAVLPSDALLAGNKTEIINVYGPAECTPTITLAPVIKDAKDGVSIGRGAGVCTWVVHPEDDSCLAPIGAVGELWVEGPLVGLGYLNDADKTAAAFVEDPVWLTRGGRHGRVYRTGDLVRYREDGSLLFVGRKDTQVKIRGQRIELGEVEHHVLKALSAVAVDQGIDSANAQVVAETIKPDETKGAILVAFIALDSAASTSEEEHASAVAKLTHGLADRLALTLPSFMMPSAFIPAHGIPVAGTGKTDRRLLRTLGAASWLKHRASADNDKTAEEDMTDLEKQLLQIWISVLNLQPSEASVNKLFTRLGGDSISAMQVVSQCRLHGLSLTASDVLQSGTVRKLAQRCQALTGGQQKTLVDNSSEDEASEEPFDLTPIQQMFFDAYPDGLDHYNQSFILDMGQPASVETLRAAMRALVGRHEMLRARYFRDASAGDRWRQRIIPMDDEDEDDHKISAYAFTYQAVASRDEMAVAAQRRQESLDIRTGPVFACDVFDIAGEQSLVLSAHHLVIDLVSWRIIWADIEDFVRQGALRGQSTASFRAWSRRQARVGSSLSPLDVLPFPVPAPELGFWALPARENTFGDCVNLTESIGRDTSSLVLGDANDGLRTEPVDLLVAAAVHSFVRAFPERPPPVVWLEGHGREQSAELTHDVSETVGWFTTMYPVPVTESAARGSLLDAVRTAKDTRCKVPGKGQPYFACRYHSVAGREAFAGHDIAEITLNFTGRYQQLESDESLFGRSEQPAEAERSITEVSESAPRTAMIEINAGVEEGRLGVSFCFHRRMRHQDRLRRWAEDGFGAALSDLALELRQTPPRPTLTDLPLLPLSYRGLDELLLHQLPAMGIRPETVANMYPCSPLQEGILLSALKGAATYDTFSVYRCASNPAVGGVSSSISPARLETAWRRIVARHTILSTIFTLHPEGGSFIQVVVPDAPVRIAHTTPSDPAMTPVAALSGMERPAFGPGDPRVAFTVCRSDAGDVACRLDLSHTLIDAYSMSLLVQELAAAYDNCEMPPAPAFSDMVRFIESTPKAQRVSSWTKLLEGVKPCVVPVALPLPGVDVKEEHGDVSLPTTLASAITDFCRDMGITRSVFLQVAWSMALSHFTGMHEACFGYLASGRDAPVDKIESLVGPLANLLIGRVDLRRPAREVLEKTLQNTIEHLSMQHASLAEIQHHLGLSGQRLFNTSLSIREADKLQGTEDRSILMESDVGEDPHEYDLSLSANIDGAKMDIVMEYREPYISSAVAREACVALEKAIEYLLSVGADETNIEPLFDGFFKRVIGADPASTSAFWKAQFAGIQESNFPPVKTSAVHEGQLDSCVKLDLCGLGWDRTDCEALVRAAWSMVTARSMGTDETTFGAVVAGDGQKTAPAVVPVRVRLDWEADTEKFIRDIREQAQAMAAFRLTGLARIRCMGDEAALACDFKTLLVVRSGDEQQAESGRAILGRGSHAMLVEVQARQNADDARVRIAFDPRTISQSRVSRVGHQFQHVLRQLASPNQASRLRDISGVSQRDLDDVWTWNSTVPAMVEGRVHDLIEHNAHHRPLAPAIDAWDGTLTYGQLNDLSTRLAYQLASQGVKRGSVVPLVFEKSMWMPVAALAVMKAGGASVAVDSTQPEERIRVIVSQARTAGRLIVVSSVANEALVRRLEPDALVTVGLDHLPEPLPECCPTLPIVSPTDVLYIVFTSGSTGRPKGATISHQNFYSAVIYQRDGLGYRSNSRIFDFASYAFDVAWSNLLNTLTVGACLCIPSAEERENDLPGSIQRYRATIADLTPSVLRSIEPKSSLSNVSTVILGGEVVLPSDALLVPDNTVVISSYGPAECTPTTTLFHLNPSSEIGIGPAVGLCTWVVDMDNPNVLAPVGAIGELWLEGPLVGLGYLAEPDKTAAAFIRDPAWLVRGDPGKREGRHGTVYRTGDLVQYKEDGSLLFVGRKDTQIKIRGQRVELGEIEYHVLQVIKAVEPTASLQIIVEAIQPKGADAKMLVAFVAIDGVKDVTPDEYDDMVRQVTTGVNDRLAETLPVFMLPTAYIPLQTVPMGPTGKADRRQLRAIGTALSAREISRLSRVEGDRRPPRNDAERTMQALWAEVLKVDPASIGIDDSFFRIGGDSIGAMRLVGLARQQGLGVSVRDIFQNPVLRDLAASDHLSNLPN